MVFNPRAPVPPPGSIGSTELAADAVTPDKVAQDVINDTIVPINKLLEVTGTTEYKIAQFDVFKNAANGFDLKKLRFFPNLKTSGVGNVTLKVYLNNDAGFDANDDSYISGTAAASITTNSATFVELPFEVDTTALADGKHSVQISLVAASATETASTDTMYVVRSAK